MNKKQILTWYVAIIAGCGLVSGCGLGLFGDGRQSSTKSPETTMLGILAEFQVNTHTESGQELPVVAALSDGGLVVVWQSYDPEKDDYDVYGQLLNASGSKVGDEFMVNTTTADLQWFQSVAGLSSGGFAVTWDSKGQDGDEYGVYGQVFDNAGNKVGGEFSVNTQTAGGQFASSIAGLTNGGFVVTWASHEPDGDQYGIRGQIFDRAGNKEGNEFQVNDVVTGVKVRPSAAGLSGGRFVVSWVSGDQDRSDYDVHGKIFDNAGGKLGQEFRVNTYTEGNQYAPSVSSLSGGGFVATWQSEGQDGDLLGVYGQVFDCLGNKAGSEFQVNTYTKSEQGEASVAGLSDGGFVITWSSEGQERDWFVSWFGIYGQVFDSAGNKVNGEFNVNTYTTYNQWYSTVAGLPGGGFIITWESHGQDGSDGGVYARMYLHDKRIPCILESDEGRTGPG